MDKLLIRKDVFNELIEKGYGKKDVSKLQKVQITDKNGHTRNVYKKTGMEQKEGRQPKAQEELTPEKKAKYEEMLGKVKAGPDENALFVQGKMLNKKEAIVHLEGKLGKKPVNSAYQGHLESENPPNTDITKEDEERFGKQALSGLSGERKSDKQTIDNFLYGNEPTPGSIMKQKQQKIMKENDNKVVIKRKYGMISIYGAKTGDHIADFPTEKARIDFMKENNLSKPDDNTSSPDIKGGEKTIERYKEVNESGSKKPSQDDMKENYLDARNEGGKDIADENRVDSHSKNAINLNDSEVKKMQKLFDYIPENAKGVQIMNTIYDEDKGLYKKLSDMDIEYKKLHPEAEGKTFGFDLATKYLEDSFNEYKKNHEVGKDKFAEMSVEDIRKEQQNLLDDYNQYYNAYKNGKNDGSKLREYFKKFDVYKTALDKKSKE